MSAGYVYLVVLALVIAWAFAAGRAIRRPLRADALPLTPGEQVLFPHPEFTLSHQVFLTNERLLWVRVPLYPLHPLRFAATPLLLVGRFFSRRDTMLSQRELSLPLNTLDLVEVRPGAPETNTAPALHVRSSATDVGIHFTSRRNTPEAWKAAIDQRRRARH